jgi:hypothetical protein
MVDPVVDRHEHHDHDGQPRLAAKRNAAAGAKASRTAHAAHAPAVLDRRAFLKILPAHENFHCIQASLRLYMCLQTMPPDIVVAEVDRILAGRADASLPVSARTPDLSTKPD